MIPLEKIGGAHPLASPGHSRPFLQPHHLTLAAFLLLLLFATGCHKNSHPQVDTYATAPTLPPPPSHHAATTHTPAPITRPEPSPIPDSLHGKPISTEIGLASWYGPPYHHRQAADGSIFDENALTAAHRTLPIGTMVRVTDIATGQSVVAKITDRGPFVQGRVLDLSLAAAKAIGLYRAGVDKVKVEAFSSSQGTADPEGRWCVQIGVFIDPADAIQLKNDLKSRFTTAKVIEFAGPTGHWVRINPASPDHATAERISNSIHLPDADSYLIRLN